MGAGYIAGQRCEPLANNGQPITSSPHHNLLSWLQIPHQLPHVPESLLRGGLRMPAGWDPTHDPPSLIPTETQSVSSPPRSVLLVSAHGTSGYETPRRKHAATLTRWAKEKWALRELHEDQVETDLQADAAACDPALFIHLRGRTFAWPVTIRLPRAVRPHPCLAVIAFCVVAGIGGNQPHVTLAKRSRNLHPIRFGCGSHVHVHD